MGRVASAPSRGPAAAWLETAPLPTSQTDSTRPRPASTSRSPRPATPSARTAPRSCTSFPSSVRSPHTPPPGGRKANGTRTIRNWCICTSRKMRPFVESNTSLYEFRYSTPISREHSVAADEPDELPEPASVPAPACPPAAETDEPQANHPVTWQMGGEPCGALTAAETARRGTASASTAERPCPRHPCCRRAWSRC